MTRVLGLTLCLVAACGGDADDDFEAPTCDDGEVRIEGTIAGEAIDEARTGYDGYIFVNALGDDLGQLDVVYADGDALSLRFPDLTANGDSVDVRGSVGFLSSGLDVGNCEDDGFPGTLRLDEDGDGGAFHLVGLRDGTPYCEADDIDGDIVGCYRSEPF